MGEKIAIVSKKPQTTRNRITGILTKGEDQYVFLDTPGMHSPKTKLGDIMVKNVRKTVGESDAVILVVDASYAPGQIEEGFIERIKKLESSGLIEGYTTIINQSILGREIMAFIYVSLEHPKHNENFIKLVKENSSIAECHYIAGDFDFILKVITQTGKSLEEVLNYIKAIYGVSLTRTSVVLSTNKSEVCLLPDIDNK